MMWKQIGLAAVVVAILAGSAAAVIIDNNNQGNNDGPQQLNQRDGSGNPDSGGGNGSRAGQDGADAEHVGEGDVHGGDREPRQGFEDAAEPLAEDDWISLDGVVTAVSGSAVDIETEAGEVVTVNLGSSRFLESLGAAFEVDDELEVMGFYEDDLFYAAEVTLAESGEQFILRDADGSLLWNSGRGQGGSGQPGGKGQPSGGGGSGQGNGNGNGSS